MATTTPIPPTDVSGQQTFNLTATVQPWTWAKITINRTGAGGSHPWFNSLTPADTLGVEFQYSLDSGATWISLGVNTLTGGSHLVKGIQVPKTNEIGVGIGSPFPTGTRFRVILTASTPLSFDGSAIYG